MKARLNTAMAAAERLYSESERERENLDFFQWRENVLEWGDTTSTCPKRTHIPIFLLQNVLLRCALHGHGQFNIVYDSANESTLRFCIVMLCIVMLERRILKSSIPEDLGPSICFFPS